MYWCPTPVPNWGHSLQPVAVLFVLLLLVGPPSLRAQVMTDSLAGAAASVAPGPWIPPLHEIRQNAVDVVQGPFALSARERRLALGATGLLLGVAATLDEPAYRHLSERSGAESAAARRATASLAGPGEWYDGHNANRLAFRTVAGLAGGGLLLREPALTRTSVRTLEAIVYTDLVVGLAKSVLNRARPYVGPAPDAFAADPGAFRDDHTALAMPSGHAGRVFAIASVLSHQADRWYVSVPLYAGASSVALERVRSGDHWLTDVVVGGAIGYVVGRSVADNGGRGRSGRTGTTAQPVRYEPVLSLGGVGLRVQF